MKFHKIIILIIAFFMGLTNYAFGSGDGVHWGYEGAERPANWGGDF